VNLHVYEAIVIEGSIPKPLGYSGGARIAFPFLCSQLHLRMPAHILRDFGASARRWRN
jgi:hypothetical protein